MNFPQSSRRSQSTTAKVMPIVNQTVSQSPTMYQGATSNVNQTFYASRSFTNSGDSNIQIKEKEKANVLHYIIGVAAIVAVVMYANKKFE